MKTNLMLAVFSLGSCLASAADLIAYADKGLAASYAGISFTAATYPNAYYNKDGVRHTATWTTSAEPPTALTELTAASELSLRVYPLTDDQDGSRLAPAYDELIGKPLAAGAYIQCYPWDDAPRTAYSSVSWEIDSYLWEHPEALPVFPRGTMQAAAKNVLVAEVGSCADATLKALGMRRDLVSKGVSKPSSAAIRAALAAGGVALVRDAIPYSPDSTHSLAVRARQSGPLKVALAWIDAGNWNYMLATDKPLLSNDLDLTITTQMEGRIVSWHINNEDRPLEALALTAVSNQTYVITLTGARVEEAGSTAALVLSGEVEEVEVPNYTYTAPWYRYDTTEEGVAYARYPLLNPTNVVEVMAGSDVPTWIYAEEPSDYLVRHFICRMKAGIEGGLPEVGELRLVRSVWIAADTFVAGEAFARPDQVPDEVEGWGIFGGATADYISDKPCPSYPVELDWPAWPDSYDFVYPYYPEDLTCACQTIPEWYFQRYLWVYYQYDEACDDYEADDPDGDGCSNLLEYRLGLNPLANAETLELRILSFSPQRITWEGPDLLQLESTTGLTNAWTKVAVGDRTLGSSTNTIPLSAACESAHFYRLSYGKETEL